MTNEKLICNQICTWNDTSDGCVKPNGRICPMSSAKIDTSGLGQVKMASEKRLIDLDSLISQLEKMESYNCSPMYRRGYDDCISTIKRQMIVDAVEVVRCKDCKHKGWAQEPCHGKSVDYCRIWECCLGNINATFCSYGERKDGDGNG